MCRRVGEQLTKSVPANIGRGLAVQQGAPGQQRPPLVLFGRAGRDHRQHRAVQQSSPKKGSSWAEKAASVSCQSSAVRYSRASGIAPISSLRMWLYWCSRDRPTATAKPIQSDLPSPSQAARAGGEGFHSSKRSTSRICGIDFVGENWVRLA